MTLRAGAYGSVAEVVPLTRYLLSGETTFTTQTIPTELEVEGFLSRASAVLDMALRNRGCKTPINTTNADSTAKIACDAWVVGHAAMMVEITHPGAGMSDEESTRAGSFQMLHKSAKEFANDMYMALKNNGATQLVKTSGGLKATNEDAVSLRSDPTDTTKSQAKFTMNKFEGI